MEYFWGRVARPIRPSSRGRSRASRRIRPPQGATSEARNLTGYPRRARSPPHGTLRLMQAIVSDQRTLILESSGDGFLFLRLLQIGYTDGCDRQVRATS